MIKINSNPISAHLQVDDIDDGKSNEWKRQRSCSQTEGLTGGCIRAAQSNKITFTFPRLCFRERMIVDCCVKFPTCVLDLSYE